MVRPVDHFPIDSTGFGWGYPGPLRLRVGKGVDLGYLTTDKPLDFLEIPNRERKRDIAQIFYRIAFSADSQGFYYKSLAAARLGESVTLVPESSADTAETSENAPQNPKALVFYF